MYTDKVTQKGNAKFNTPWREPKVFVIQTINEKGELERSMLSKLGYFVSKNSLKTTISYKNNLIIPFQNNPSASHVPPIKNMQSKVAIITGGNAGIGKHTAIGLAKEGINVVLFCRNEAKGKAAQAEIQKLVSSSNIDLIICDLASLQSVQKAANEFRSRYNRLDLLINNAGLFVDYLTKTQDDLETQFQVNHLSHFYLTQLLMDALQKSAPARIVNVSSAAHRGREIDFDDLANGKEKYNGLDVYGQTKLANVLFAYELSHRYAASGISAFALHPGVVRTQIGRKNTKGWVNWGWKILTSLPLFTISEEEGAATSLYAALSPDLEEVSGKYLRDSKIIKSTKQSYDEATARRLWEWSERLLEEKIA